jgi:hydrogenase maturation protein HypF
LDSIFKKQFLIQGKVQGVGFRPYVYRLALDLKLAGSVQNVGVGVKIVLIGSLLSIEKFQKKLVYELPLRARIDSIKECENTETLESGQSTVLQKEFKIIESEEGRPQTSIPQDVATCSLCLAEIWNPKDRRYLHPFTHCIHCGPRFSIITSLPYDRKRTTMNEFEMCPSCANEYRDPLNRRFHSQTNSCWNCGPVIRLSQSNKKIIAEGQSVFAAAAALLKQDKIIAVKTVGGFQLWVNAKSDSAVVRLRERKNRPTKPFAVLCSNLLEAKKLVCISENEEKLLQSEVAPIVLLKSKNVLSPNVAPKNPYLGVMLPSSPIQNLILYFFNHKPVVATSGNLSGEPICIDNEEAFARLSHIADYFIFHDRKIQRPLDDSIVQIVLGQKQNLRIGRGLAPLELSIQSMGNLDVSMIAFGGDLKSSISVYRKNQIFLGPHIGDLEDVISQNHYDNYLEDFSKLLGLPLQKSEDSFEFICDKHPEYISSKKAYQRAAELFGRVYEVQHHRAHAMSAILEFIQENKNFNFTDQALEPIIVFAWDGTGFGDDTLLWGSEVFFSQICKDHFSILKPFPMPGGSVAIKDPRRLLFGLLWSYDLLEDFHEIRDQLFSSHEIKTLKLIIEKKINCPWTTSMGRVFDTFAVLFGLGHENSFEGELACQLEFAARRSLECRKDNLVNKNDEWDLRKFLLFCLKTFEDRPFAKDRDVEATNELALQFHLFLVELVRRAVQRVIKNHPLEKNKSFEVFLTGGVFQNRLLTELIKKELTLLNCRVHIHKQIPPNDGGISAGQLFARSLSIE